MNVCQDIDEICLVFNELTLEPPAEQRAVPLVPPGEILGVYRSEMLHGIRKVSEGRPHEKMVAVRHEGVGMDFDTEKLAMAKQMGAETVDLSAGEDPIAAANAFSRGKGVDAVLICASTKSNDPVHQAATMSRKRGRIVLVGVVGLELAGLL